MTTNEVVSICNAALTVVMLVGTIASGTLRHPLKRPVDLLALLIIIGLGSSAILLWKS